MNNIQSLGRHWLIISHFGSTFNVSISNVNPFTVKCNFLSHLYPKLQLNDLQASTEWPSKFLDKNWCPNHTDIAKIPQFFGEVKYAHNPNRMTLKISWQKLMSNSRYPIPPNISKIETYANLPNRQFLIKNLCPTVVTQSHQKFHQKFQRSFKPRFESNLCRLIQMVSQLFQTAAWLITCPLFLSCREVETPIWALRILRRIT